MTDFPASCHPGTANAALAALGMTSVEGTYCEFGVYKGGTFCRVAYRLNWWAQITLAHTRGHITSMWGFDSFQGFPEPTSEHDKAHYYAGLCCNARFEDVCSALAGVLGSPVDKHGDSRASSRGNGRNLIKGFFAETLTPIMAKSVSPISVALIDCDSYSGTSEVLAFIAPLMRDGSILVLDDIELGDECQKKAFEDFKTHHENKYHFDSEPIGKFSGADISSHAYPWRIKE